MDDLEQKLFTDFADTDIVKFIKTVNVVTNDFVNSLIDLNEWKICLKVIKDYFNLFLSKGYENLFE